ncbi:MAG: acyltransferase [Rhodanobacter sp.]|jgi:peptidoglycan/LPS O-acetylase OafA/YrhL|nr:acyltransferase [Rhodanobacter sp.]
MDNFNRLQALDGWRGISILCVLAGHMLPLGPKSLAMNGAIATTGMSLFFILSGFLIVSMLNRNGNVLSFLVRRVCRIIPLAWAYLIVVLLVTRASGAAWSANLLFYANLPPFYLGHMNGHFWSLGVEVQFYAGIAVIVACAGRAGLMLVPLLCLAVTAVRIVDGVPISIVTWSRIDEILAGGCLALAYASPRCRKVMELAPPIAPLLIAPLLVASSHQAFGALNYARPYLAALLIGSTLLQTSGRINTILRGQSLRYLAEISYALYVIHPATYAGWLGEGGVVTRYTKRIASFGLSFLFAHISTRTFEKYWIGVGHRLATSIEVKAKSKPGSKLKSSER